MPRKRGRFGGLRRSHVQAQIWKARKELKPFYWWQDGMLFWDAMGYARLRGISVLAADAELRQRAPVIAPLPPKESADA